MDLQSFLSEVPVVPTDTPGVGGSTALLAASSPAAPPEPKPVPATVTTETQHLRMKVPNPAVYLRMGKSAEYYGLDGFMVSSAYYSSHIAGKNMITVAGEKDWKKAYEFTKSESSGQTNAQTTVSVVLDVMKLFLVPTLQTAAAVGTSLGFGLKKVTTEKSGQGNYSVVAKETLSLVSAGHAQLTGLATTTVWGSMTKCGASTAISVQGGLFAAVSSTMNTCLLGGRITEVISGWETEIASRFGEVVLYGKEIKIGDRPSHLDVAVRKVQRATKEVTINATKEVRLTTNARDHGSFLHPHPHGHQQDALIEMKHGNIEVEGDEVSLRAEESMTLHVGASTVVIDKEELNLGVFPAAKPSSEAMSVAMNALIKAKKQITAVRDAAIAASAAPMVPHATAEAARAAAEALYESSMEAATAARAAALKASYMSTPTLHLGEEAAHLKTSATNAVMLSRSKGIKLVSGACEITLTPAGIVLKFGHSKIVLGPVGIVIDAGKGVIVQKAITVNSP